MGTAQSTIDHLLDQLAAAGDFSARKMFGEYCLYLSGRPVALVCDDQLFLKPTEAARARLPIPAEAAPYPGARPHLLVSADLWEDRDALAALLHAQAMALPPPKVKRADASARRKSKSPKRPD